MTATLDSTVANHHLDGDVNEPSADVLDIAREWLDYGARLLKEWIRNATAEDQEKADAEARAKGLEPKPVLISSTFIEATVGLGQGYAAIAAVEVQRQQTATVGLLEDILDEVRILTAPQTVVVAEAEAESSRRFALDVAEEAAEQAEATG